MEFYLSKAACVFAISVALFPTQNFRAGEAPPSWATFISNAVGSQPTDIHYWAAAFLFVCLIAMIWFFSNRAKSKGRLTRAYIYRVISILMVVGMLAIFAFVKLMKFDNTTLLIEMWGLTLFGIVGLSQVAINGA